MLPSLLVTASSSTALSYPESTQGDSVITTLPLAVQLFYFTVWDGHLVYWKITIDLTTYLTRAIYLLSYIMLLLFYCFMAAILMG